MKFCFCISLTDFSLCQGIFFAVFWIKNPQKGGSVLDPLEFGENLDQNWAFPGILPKFGGAEGDFRGNFGDPKPLPVFPRPIPGFLQLGAPEDNGNPINYRDPIIGINSFPASQLLQSRGFGIFSPISAPGGRSREKSFPKMGILGEIPFWSNSGTFQRSGMRLGCSCWVWIQKFPNSPQKPRWNRLQASPKMGKKRLFQVIFFPLKTWKNPTQKQGKRGFST